MPTETIQLIVVKGDDLGRESEILNESVAVNYSLVNAGVSLTPNQIIQQVLGLPSEESERVPIDGLKGRGGGECTLITSYQLTCPSFSAQLEPDIPIDDQGIVADMVFVLVRCVRAEYDRPEDDPFHNVCYCLSRTRSAQHFNQIVRTRLDRRNRVNTDWDYDSPLFLAALLYTDEDAELAKYVRLNFAALDVMSGRECEVFVIERSPEMRFSETLDYWKELLAFKTYVLWGGLGWTHTKPYDKSSAYGIARQLNILPNQLPCIAFFEDITDNDKVIIPIQGEPSDFFRTLFGFLQEIYPASLENREYWRPIQQRHLLGIKKRIIAHSSKVASDERTAIYNFNGHTVFVNQPSGHIQLSDFQNTPDSASETSDKGEKRK
jgi:hypothetical protein